MVTSRKLALLSFVGYRNATKVFKKLDFFYVLVCQ